MDPETIRILLVEDDPTDATFTQAMLTRVRDAVVEVTWVATVAEGLEALRIGRFDVALVDYLLGRENGLDLVRSASEMDLNTPMILLTGKGSREVDFEAQAAGVDDYLVKGRIDPDSLERALRYALERARNRSALVESEGRLRALFDHLPLGLFRCTPTGEFLDANPTLVDLLGNPSPELLRSRYAAHFYVHPSDLDRMKQVLQRDGVVRGFESWLERGDGFHLPVRTTARAHRGADGTVMYVEGVVEDVREQESVHRIRRGQSRFRAVFDQLGLDLAFTDVEGRVLDVSPGFARRWRRDPADLVMKPIDALLSPRGGAAMRAARESFQRGAFEPITFATDSADGAPLTVTCAPVGDEVGEAHEIVVRLADGAGP
ncbi:MAG: response regulator [Gemmatimonadetes bacterium]|nr:response regulator [Gemmatimonadota bacterium]